MRRTIDSVGEDRLLGWLRRAAGRHGDGSSGDRLIGDDAAILPRVEPWAVTVDNQIEGVHFLPGLDPAILARRLLAVNLSDLAAMGAAPSYAFLALATPTGFDHRRFFTSLLRASRAAGLLLAGGDLARSQLVSAALTVLGCRHTHGRWLRRSEAVVGQNVWIGGTLGEAALGLHLLLQGARLDGRVVLLPESLTMLPQRLASAARSAVRRHLLPVAQLELGAWLASRPRGAAIDVSDGLARDLHRLCRESGCGAVIELSCLPTPAGFAPLLAHLGLSHHELVLGGGEDYVLLFTLDDGLEPPAALGCRKIGRVIAGTAVDLIVAGRREPLPPVGWDHLQKDPAHLGR